MAPSTSFNSLVALHGHVTRRSPACLNRARAPDAGSEACRIFDPQLQCIEMFLLTGKRRASVAILKAQQHCPLDWLWSLQAGATGGGAEGSKLNWLPSRQEGADVKLYILHMRQSLMVCNRCAPFQPPCALSAPAVTVSHQASLSSKWQRYCSTSLMWAANLARHCALRTDELNVCSCMLPDHCMAADARLCMRCMFARIAAD